MEYWVQLLFVCLIWATASPGVAGRNGTSSSSDDNAALYGGIIFTGGYIIEDVAREVMDSVEVIGTFALPALPQPTSGHTVNSVGNALYLCGGKGQEAALNECLILETKSVAPQWKHFTYLPVAMFDHTAVTIDSDIWIAYNSILYVVHTSNGLVVSYSLPFYAFKGFCVVSNSVYSYMIGVGDNKNEIWMNEEAYNPSSWKKVYTLETSNIYFGCLWHDNTIYITGGETGERSVLALDVNNYELTSIQDMITGRNSHRMFMLDGKPAVAGGRNQDDYFNSIETYDVQTMEWQTNKRKLEQERATFSVTEVYDI